MTTPPPAPRARLFLRVGALGFVAFALPGSLLAAIAGWHYVPLTLAPPASAQFSGQAIADAGDVNGDGYSDALVGASGVSGNDNYVGRAYLFFGGPNADALPDVTFYGSSVGDEFGRAVAGAGDVNGDGYADIIIGAPGDDTFGAHNGRWYLYFGGLAVDNVADLSRLGLYHGWLGLSVASAGDVNNDGFADVIVGEPLNERALIYFGAAAMNNLADVVLTHDGLQLGYRVAGVGDVNGDNFDDVVVLSQWDSAFLYLGGASMNGFADGVFEHNTSTGNVSISGAGDVNYDGYDDIILGAAGTLAPGKAYIFRGGPLMNMVPDVILTEGATLEWFGASVAKGGNLNGDAYSDVLVGSWIGAAGTVFGYNGGNPMNTVKDRSLTGKYVSGLAKWNGDSRNDFMVGGNGVVTIYYSKFYGPFPSPSP